MSQDAATTEALDLEARRVRKSRDKDLQQLREGLAYWKTRALAAAVEPCNEHEIALTAAAAREQRLIDDLAISSRANNRHVNYWKRARAGRERWRNRTLLREQERDAALAELAQVEARHADSLPADAEALVSARRARNEAVDRATNAEARLHAEMQTTADLLAEVQRLQSIIAATGDEQA